MEQTASKQNWIPFVLAAGLAIALYAHTLGGTYVYDDAYIVKQDIRVANPDLWIEYFTEAYFQDAADHLWRPLTSLTYAIQWQIHGDRPWMFHLVNILLHALASGLCAELLRRITSSNRIALIAGLLFAAHPVHVEAVANIVGRAEVLCGVGILGAMVLLAKRPIGIGRVLAICGCFIVAILSKEHGMTLPFLLGALVYFTRDEWRPRSEAEKRNLGILFFTICLIFTAYVFYRESTKTLRFSWHFQHFDWTMNPLAKATGIDKQLLPIVYLGHYVRLLIFPFKLIPDYGGEIIGYQIRWDEPYIYLGFAAIVVGAVGISLALRKRWNAVGFFLIGLAIVYGVISQYLQPIGTSVAERLMYIPSIFFIGLASMALAKIPKRALTIVVPMLLIVLSIRTITYAWQWNDPLRLFEYAVKVEPRSIRMQMALADMLTQRGELERADEVNKTAIAMMPDYWQVWRQSARTAYFLGDYDRAEKDIMEAFKLFGDRRLLNFRRAILDKQAAATQPTTSPQ